MTKRNFLVVVICLAYLEVYGVNGGKKESKNLAVIKYGAEAVAQPCKPHDSCRNRCVNDRNEVFSLKESITIGQFNCFCDNDCETFG